MRVTKIIRDYVEKSVTDKYQSRFESIDQVYGKQKAELNRELALVLKDAEAKAQAILSQYEGYEATSYGVKEGHIFSMYPVYNRKVELLNSDLYHKLRAEVKQKIDDILVSLELGADKKELDEMLRSI